jgi:glycosyltransferase involved in cell wall biosynthesis
LISVIVPVHNGLPWLEHQIRALVDQECPTEWELLIVDDGSTDRSAIEARRWAADYPVVHVLGPAGHRGAAAARNTGAGAARGDLLAFCDADDVVREHWLAGMAAALADNDVVSGVFDFWSLRHVRPSPPIPPATAQLGFLPAGLASNLGVCRAAFDEVGGFAEDLAVGEDIDLCWRLQLRGYRFAVSEACVVAKRERGDLRQVFRRSLAYGRCGPRLFKRHRASGAHRYVVGATKSWGLLLISAPKLVTAAHRRDWARMAGVRVGRLEGSIKEGVFFP